MSSMEIIIKIYIFIMYNGFNKLIIENVDIGPNYQEIPITPRYAHWRLLLELYIFLSVNVYNNYLQSTQGIVSFNITTNK